MRAAFDGAEVPEHAIARFEPAMTNAAEDRHVLAAAVASEAQAVVTLNLKDFATVERRAAVLTRPPMTINELLDRLEATVPRFVAALRS